MPARRDDHVLKVRISLPSELIIQVDHSLLDPDTGKPAFGARSRLVERLLRDYLIALHPPEDPEMARMSWGNPNQEFD